MSTIRLPKAVWAQAWRAMIEVAPVRLIVDDPVSEELKVTRSRCAFDVRNDLPHPRRSITVTRAGRTAFGAVPPAAFTLALVGGPP
jgi:hypothetical protein